MRLPRFRIRTLMIVVAALAVSTAISTAFAERLYRARWHARQAAAYSTQANACPFVLFPDPQGPGFAVSVPAEQVVEERKRLSDLGDVHRLLSQRYRRQAWRFWEPGQP